MARISLRWTTSWRRALLAAGLALVVAVIAERLLLVHFEHEARVRTRNAMAPYAGALTRAVERRVALLAGLRSFADSRDSRRTLDTEFETFARGSLVGFSGVVALQLVDSGRIVRTWPVVGNEAILGYNILSDARPGVADDVRRAMASGDITVTGPIALIQGGNGLLVRQRLTARDSFPDLAAVVLDIPTVIAEAGITGDAPDLVLEVRDRAQEWFGGDHSGTTTAPETLLVSVPDGDWSLIGSPRAGWSAAINVELVPTRAALAALVLAAGLLGFVVGGREERLVRAAADHGARLDLALRAGRMGAWEYDIATDRVHWSDAAAQILGPDGAAASGRWQTMLEWVPAVDRAELRRISDELAAGRRTDFLAEFRVNQPEGEPRWVLCIGEAERDASGKLVRMIGVLSDISQLRTLEDRVRRSQRLEAVGTLASGVAHDFNNLLAAITGFTELALVNVRGTNESAAADLEQVLATTKRAAALTAQLLAFSRQAKVEPVAVDVSAVVRDLDPMLRQLIGDAHRFRTELAADLPVVRCDQAQLTQVLLNLVVNARDATPPGGSIKVGTRQVDAREVPSERAAAAPRWICVEVEDSGSGMSPEVRDKIFEPYFTTKKQDRGTGLGLAVVYGAVENAGGVIEVDTAVGAGTRFRVYLPAIG